jgi:hypothetical protein
MTLTSNRVLGPTDIGAPNPTLQPQSVGLSVELRRPSPYPSSTEPGPIVLLTDSKRNGSMIRKSTMGVSRLYALLSERTERDHDLGKEAAQGENEGEFKTAAQGAPHTPEPDVRLEASACDFRT